MTTDLAPITPASSIEQIATNKGILQAMKSRIRELEAQHEEQMLEYVQANGPTTIGDVRYYAGNEKDTKDHDRNGAGDALYEVCLEQCGGDVHEAFRRFVSDCLASQPFKPGTAKEMLGGNFDRYFTITEKIVLKDGKPSKKVLSVPIKFLAQRSAK